MIKSIKLDRYYQALKYKKKIDANTYQDAYGMECNACTLMYFLQSLGLIPPDISRKEFEYAFTSLLPYEDEERIQKKANVMIGGKRVDNSPYPWDKKTAEPLPINLIKSNVLSEGALLGFQGVSGIATTQSACYIIEAVIEEFVKITSKDEYSFLSKNHEKIVKDYIYGNKKYIVSLLDKLNTGSLSDEYFNYGGVIYSKIKYSFPFNQSDNHYVVIVDNYIDSFLHNNKTYYIYPADDSLWSNVNVIVPFFDIKGDTLPQQITTNSKKSALYFEGKRLHSIFDLAVGIKI